MICDVCKNCIEGVWDDAGSRRIALVNDFLRDSKSRAIVSQYRHDDDAPSYVRVHHEDEASVHQSKDKGCSICTILFHPFAVAFDEFECCSVFFVGFITLEERREMFVQIMTKSGTYYSYIEPHTFHDVEFSAHLDRGISTDHPTSWQTMEGWMKTCFEGHHQCGGSPAITNYRPRRLLKIEADDTYRLVAGSECPNVLQYVALSHCWGKQSSSNSPQLLQSTHPQLINPSPCAGLPKTFRDAIRVIRHFGYSYIWIDRLCILQDSREDWQREASSMKEVYQNAVFSIGALGAADSDGGLFMERISSRLPPTILRLRSTVDGPVRTFRTSDDRRESDRESRNEFLKEPLIKRSWVLQERLLAPRTLYFGSSDIYWECHTACCSERNPHGLHKTVMYSERIQAEEPILKTTSQGGLSSIDPGRRLGHKRPLPHFRSLVRQGLAIPGLLRKELLDQSHRLVDLRPQTQNFRDWVAIVEFYSGLNLTLTSDKLVALSGLAKEMRQQLRSIEPGQYRYVAGLWVDDLPDTLLWRPTREDRATKSLVYRAPSWSWASMNGPITFTEHRIRDSDSSGDPRYYSSVDFVHTTTMTNDDTGEVSDGMLAITGPCAIANLCARISSHSSAKVERVMNQSGEVLFEWEEEESSLDVDATYDVPGDFVTPALHIMIKEATIDAEEAESPWMGQGLLLEDLGQGLYRRFGITYFFGSTRHSGREFLDRNDTIQVKII